MGSYYDVDAILTDGDKVPCAFELDIPGLGYLDENPGGDVCAFPPASLAIFLCPVDLGPSYDSSSLSEVEPT